MYLTLEMVAAEAVARPDGVLSPHCTLAAAFAGQNHTPRLGKEVASLEQNQVG